MRRRSRPRRGSESAWRRSRGDRRSFDRYVEGIHWGVVTEQLPNAEITFDKFHAVSLVNEAVDEVRRQECKTHPELAGTRYVWLKNEANLTNAQAEQLGRFDLSRCYLKTARAHQIRLAFQGLYTQDPEHAEYYLKRWYFWATHSCIEPVVRWHEPSANTRTEFSGGSPHASTTASSRASTVWYRRRRLRRAGIACSATSPASSIWWQANLISLVNPPETAKSRKFKSVTQLGGFGENDVHSEEFGIGFQDRGNARDSVGF